MNVVVYLNLDSAVQDARAMQDLESESLLMGAEHSQKVKAAPIKSDYGYLPLKGKITDGAGAPWSETCIALASSTAEFRLIGFKEELLLKSSWRPFLWLNLSACILVASWWIPGFWPTIDTWAFKALQDSIRNSYLSQVFWAVANVKLTDLFGAAFIINFTLLYLLDTPKEERLKRVAQFIYYLLWFEIGIFSVKQIFTMLNVLRDSPTLLSHNPILLSSLAPWLKIKDSSHWSFPSDHAFIILEWVGFIFAYAGYRLGTIAAITSSLFILPRLISGAHWLSDVLVGSLPLALVFMSIACYTPIYQHTITFILRVLLCRKKQKTANMTSSLASHAEQKL